MVGLATGQQMADMMRQRKVPLNELTEDEIFDGNGGVVLNHLGGPERDVLVKNTPLWFYILREAEKDGCLGDVGGRIVAEVFHRAMEGSEISILRDPWWRPSFGSHTFSMVDLLLFAFEGKAELLNPLGD